MDRSGVGAREGATRRGGRRGFSRAHGHTFGQSFEDYRATRDLIEWVCSRVRQHPPTETERWFHLTTIALAQGARDDSFLSGVKRLLSESLRTSGAHAEHASSRFPHEGRFKLASVTASWEAQFIATFPLPPNYLFKTLYGRFETESVDATGSIRRTLQQLQMLFGDPEVGAEARLRSGVLKFEFGDAPAARFDLQRAEAAKDDGVRHLAHLMLGAIAEQAGDRQEALRRFRLAYDILPASAASVALAGRLYRSGAEEEAREILQRFEAQAPPPGSLGVVQGSGTTDSSTDYRVRMRRALEQMSRRDGGIRSRSGRGDHRRDCRNGSGATVPDHRDWCGGARRGANGGRPCSRADIRGFSS